MKVVIKQIWATSKGMGMTKDDLYNVLQRETGKDGMRDCSEQELKRVLLALRTLQGFKEERGNRASNRQLWKIRQMEQQLGWSEQPKRLQGFIGKFYKVDRIEWLTSGQAWRLIESLKKLIEKQGG